MSRPSALEPLSSSGKCLMPVGQAVGQAGLAEPAVAAARAEAHRLRLEDGDAQRRVRVGQGDRRPQPGEAAAHDGDVDVESLAGGQRRVGGVGRPGRGASRCRRPRRRRDAPSGAIVPWRPCHVGCDGCDIAAATPTSPRDSWSATALVDECRVDGGSPACGTMAPTSPSRIAQRLSHGPVRDAPRPAVRERGSVMATEPAASADPQPPPRPPARAVPARARDACPAARTRTSARGASRRSTSIAARAAWSGTSTATSSSTCAWAMARSSSATATSASTTTSTSGCAAASASR